MSIHVGETPTVQFAITEDAAAVDLSGASAVELVFEKPSGATLTKTGTVTGTDSNIIQASLSASEVDESGIWRAQGKITALAGWTGYSKEAGFVVNPAIA